MLGEGSDSRTFVATHYRRVARDIAKHDRGKFARWNCFRLAHSPSGAPIEAEGIGPRSLTNWLNFLASSNQGIDKMIFKVTFVDGSVEMVHAGTPGEARLYATRQFRDRIAVKVERAGLTDMINLRPSATQKPPSRGN